MVLWACLCAVPSFYYWVTPTQLATEILVVFGETSWASVSGDSEGRAVRAAALRLEARPGAAPAGFGEVTFEGRSWWNVGDADTRKWFGLNTREIAKAAEQLGRLGTSHFDYLKPAAGTTFERCYGTTDAACALHATLEGLAFVAWGGFSVDITTGVMKEQYTSAVSFVLRIPPMACNVAMPAERRTAVITSVASWWGAGESAALTADGVKQRKRAWKASASLRKRKKTNPPPPPPRWG